MTKYKNMESSITDKAHKWLNSNIDEESKNEIQRMLNAGDGELTEAFYKDLEFGTGGLRGIMGVGSNRMNKYTVAMATQGLSNYLLKSFPGENIKVAIAYDSRNNSQYFADVTASVFSANGIKVYLFESLRPTPELSYTIRHFNCKSGVVLTASHNPKEYNGYKAYWDDGAQLTSPHDKNVIDEVNMISGIDAVNFQKDESKIELIGSNIDLLYMDAILDLSLSKDAIERQKDLKIVFTPIHGTGAKLVPDILQRMGFNSVTVVKEQAEPDGNFPTVVYPNPEEADALGMALEEAKNIDADLVMATDPDADRVGIAVKNHHQKFQLLNGNQTASLLIYYLLKKWQENGKLSGDQYIVKTIVTTDLLDTIAAHFNVACFNTLTGFKYIASLLRELEGKKEFIAGGEESYGYLISDFVRDKDAIASCAMIAEMTAYAKDQGISLFDMLIEIYNEFGLYKEHLISVTKKGKSGAEEIERMMLNLRNNPPKEINHSRVIKIIDYETGIEKNVSNGIESNLDFPSSNVLQFFLEDGTKISARPSGTEPKIKFYIGVRQDLLQKEDYDSINMELAARIQAVIASMGLDK